MTEAEWRRCDDPARLFDRLGDGQTQRKLLLLIVGCFRHQPETGPWRSHPTTAVLMRGLEQVADGECGVDDLRERFPMSHGPAGWHPVQHPRGWARVWAEARRDLAADPVVSGRASLVRCLFGNPFRPAAVNPCWLTSTVVDLASGIYADRAWDRLPILADALEDVGCIDADVIGHCRSSGPHARGCWVVDLLLGKS